ncbi:MAG: DUF4159 domain-containing protein [Myxococcales bacterium]|nr:DUF4159 domain-containing protein [Myxococcales bacterium]
MSRFLSRRSVLAAGLATPGFASAFGDASRFIPAVAQHSGTWDVRASGLRRLAWELQRRTSVEAILEARATPLDSPKLFELPFVYLSSDRELPAFTAAQTENLRRYLTFGGFVFADANDGSIGSGFDASFRREMAKVLPQVQPRPLPATHVVFKSFFLLDTAPGRFLNSAQLDAWTIGKRAAVIYSQNDVMGALARDESGTYEYEVTPGGERQREYAARLAINIAMYALCLDYKDDGVHILEIMRRRR